MSMYFWDFDPFHELDSLQRRLDRLYGSATPAIEATGKPTTMGPSTVATAAPPAADNTLFNWRPKIDVKETEKEFLLHADIPGVREGDMNVSIEDGLLTVTGRREASKHTDDANARYHRVERSFGSFSRSVRLPDNVDPATVTAAFDNGVLEVRVPKSLAPLPKRIAVQIAHKPAAQALPVVGKPTTEPSPAQMNV